MITDALTAEQVAIPHEPEQWMCLRRLAWTELDSAAKAHERDALGGLMDLPSEVLAEAMKGALATTTTAATRRTYSKRLVLRCGIVSWSYAVAPEPAVIDRLDPVTAEWAYREILKLSGVVDTEEDRKNASSGSTGGSTETPPTNLTSPT